MNKERGREEFELDSRYAPYVEMYISFDSSIWQMPPFLIGAVTVLIGLAVSLFENNNGGAPAGVWVAVLVSSAIILLLGAYSMWRIGLHQALLGDELRRMEDSGYFHARRQLRRDSRTPTAPSLFIAVFMLLAAILIYVAVSIFLGDEFIRNSLRIAN